MVSTLVYKCVKGRISVCEDWSRPYRNIYSTRGSLGLVILCLYYLVMHSMQSILHRGPKIYNDLPLKIKSLNNPESFKYI